jgi:hypothetical protein
VQQVCQDQPGRPRPDDGHLRPHRGRLHSPSRRYWE